MTMSRTVPASGNPLIDHQHGHLTELMRQVAMCARGDAKQFGDAVREFRAALAEHFAVEGIILRGVGFSGTAEHDAAHVAILDRLTAIVESLPAPVISPNLHEIVAELEQILSDHELLEDSSYWEAIRSCPAVPPVAWDASLETGVAWIDDQHRQLAAIINEAIVATVLPRGETVIADLMERFLGRVREHFAAEERQLDAWGIPVLPHRAEHLRLLEEVETLAAAAGGDPRVLVDHYLRFWMIDHIREADIRDFVGRG